MEVAAKPEKALQGGVVMGCGPIYDFMRAMILWTILSIKSCLTFS
jgi:hypothetical protein